MARSINGNVKIEGLNSKGGEVKERRRIENGLAVGEKCQLGRK